MLDVVAFVCGCNRSFPTHRQMVSHQLKRTCSVFATEASLHLSHLSHPSTSATHSEQHACATPAVAHAPSDDIQINHSDDIFPPDSDPNHVNHIETTETEESGLPESMFQQVRFQNSNYAIVSRIINRAGLSDQEAERLIGDVNKLDFTFNVPESLRDLRRAETEALEQSSIISTELKVPLPTNKNGHVIVEYSHVITLYRRDPFSLIQNILDDSTIASACEWTYRGNGIDFGELCSSEWWRSEQASLPGKSILAVILASDECPITLNGRSVHPVYISLGNIPGQIRTQLSAKRLYGFIPMVRLIRAYSDSKRARKFQRLLTLASMQELMKPFVQGRDGVVVKIGSEFRLVYPRVPFIVADESEMLKLCNMFRASTCTKPCNTCDCNFRTDGICTIGNMRTKENVLSLDDNGLHEKCIHSDSNPLHEVPGLDVFGGPPCRMHQTDHGIFVKLLELVMAAVAKERKTPAFDVRWSELGRVPDLKVFARGVSDLAFVTASEHRAMAMSLPFVLNGLLKDERSLIASMTYLRWRHALSSLSFDRDDLRNLEDLGRTLQSDMQSLANELKNVDIGLMVKFHKIGHWHVYIRRFGAPTHYNAETYEFAHKMLVKVHAGNVQVCDSLPRTLLERDSRSELQREAASTTPKAMMTSDRVGSAVPLGRSVTRLVEKHDFSVATEYRKLYLPSDSSWLRAGDNGHSVMLTHSSYKVYGKLEKIITFDNKTIVVVVSVYKKCTGTSKLYRFCERFQWAKLELRAYYAHQIKCAVLMHPDFSAGEPYFFMNNYLY